MNHISNMNHISFDSEFLACAKRLERELYEEAQKSLKNYPKTTRILGGPIVGTFSGIIDIASKVGALAEACFKCAKVFIDSQCGNKFYKDDEGDIIDADNAMEIITLGIVCRLIGLSVSPVHAVAALVITTVRFLTDPDAHIASRIKAHS